MNSSRVQLRHFLEVNQEVSKTTKAIDRQAFRSLYETQIDDSQLKLSNHAIRRLNERNIELGIEDLTRISETLEKAELKGAKESVVFYKDLTLIASVKNRTIITAITAEDQVDGIFTNIDSALVIK